jgi:hypothetical protein
MSDGAGTVPIMNDETLARFVVRRQWIRQDGTVKQDAFVPPPDLELSVTRHLGLTESQLWAIGEQVALELKTVPLLGRADVTVQDVHRCSLRAVVAELPNNPNHAHILDWPTEKAARKMVALELAASARFTRR